MMTGLDLAGLTADIAAAAARALCYGAAGVAIVGMIWLALVAGGVE